MAISLTQDRTPPIKPRLYPAAKSEVPDPFAFEILGISKWLRRDKAEGDAVEYLGEVASASFFSVVGVRAGLAGLLDCQN